MADDGLGLPIRTDGDVDNKVQVKIVDEGTPSQQMTVDTDKNAHVEIHGNDPSGNDTVIATDTIGRTRVVVEDTSDGLPIHDFDAAAAVASAATVTHDYTVPGGKTHKLRKVLASASGRMKVEVFVGPIGTLVLKAVAFNSASNPNIDLEFSEPIDVAAADIVRVSKTNRESNPAQAQDLYSTIIGNDV